MPGSPLLALLLILRGATPLPPRGEGYEIPMTWRIRGLSFGTKPLVDLIERAARKVRHQRPGATLYVGDLSRPDGRPTEWHRSHRRGRDADLLFFATDENGEPAPPPVQMIKFDGSGRADTAWGTLYFDTDRNWLLVKALLEDPVTVTRIFVAEPLKERLLAWARAHGEPERIVQRAQWVLGQPGDSLPHDDHMHVRIAGGWEPVHLRRHLHARRRQRR